MKKLLLCLMLLIVNGAAISQDILGQPTTRVYTNTLTATVDTIDVLFRTDLGINYFTIMAYNGAGVDSVDIYFLGSDATTWTKRGVLSLATNVFTSQMITSTTAESWLIVGSVPNKLRLVSNSNDASTTTFVITGGTGQVQTVSPTTSITALTVIGGSALQDSLNVKVSKSDSTSAAPGYATKSQHNTKVAKVDTTTAVGGSYWTPTQARGDQTFTGATVNGVSKFRSVGTIQSYWEDTDAADGQQPFWYLESANNGSKGIFYLGYANRTGSSTYGATDVALFDSVSATFGSTIGTGTKAVYGLSFNGFTLRQGSSLSDTTKFPLTTSLKQGAYLSDTTKFFLNSDYVAGIDSFTTTSATDTVTIAGVSATSIVLGITPMYPAYSADVDTANCGGVCLVSGAGDHQLAVTRAKSYTGNGATALKSGAIYYYFIKK